MQTIPLIILGGSDRKPTRLPDERSDLHPLTGYKAVDFRPAAGRSLLEVVLDRANASGAFDPVYVAGPASIYASIVPADLLIDTNGTFGENIQAAVETVSARHPECSLGFMTCDIIADVEGLKRLMAQYWQTIPCDLWFPIVKVPPNTQQLGASDWKPKYRVVPEPGEDAVQVLPGHLLVADVHAIRLGLAYDLFQIAYKTRNRPITPRRNAVLRAVAGKLFYHDLRHILGFRLPTLTISIVRAIIMASKELRSGTITRERLENMIRLVGVKYRHRKAFPERRIHLPIIEDLSLALDIDTEEEAEAVFGRIDS